MKPYLAFAALILATTAYSQGVAQSSGTCAAPPSMPLKSNSVLTVDAHQADFEVIGTDQEGIRVACKLRHQEDAGKIKISFSMADGANSLQFKGGPKNNVSIHIEVPRRTDLRLRATAGDLKIDHVIGNKDIRLRFGDISVSPVTIEEYGSVQGSVRIGDINVPGGGAKKEDFFRSFATSAAPGKFHLDAHVTIGDITFAAP